MPNPTPELPDWMQIQIKKWASENAQTEQHVFDEVRYCGLIDGATEYAAIAIQLRARLKYVKSCLEHQLPTDEIIEFIDKSLALFPVDKNNSQENKIR